MIFLVFCALNAILLASAALSGGVGSFVNLDSVLITLAGAVLSAAAIGQGRYGALLRGLGQAFSFSGRGEKSAETRTVYVGVSVMTLALGLCSTIQGLFAAFILESSPPFGKCAVYASFSSVYALILVAFLFAPVICRNS